MDNKSDFSANRRLLPVSAIALGIGALCSLIAVALLKIIYFFTNLFFYQQISFAFHSPADNHLGLLVIFVPALGGLLIGLMARYGSDRIRGHGIPEALEAILFNKSRMQPKLAIIKPLSAAVSIGSGGPFGAEGPIIMTGGAFGSIIAQAFHLTAAERRTLLVAGAAAGMSATFATPVAAVLLAVELLLFEWKPRSVVPVALASAVAAAIRPLVLGPGPLFPMPPHGLLPVQDLLGAAFAGLLAGLFSALLTGAVYKFEDLFHRLPIHWMWWPAIGGVVIGIGGYFQPRALGVGYDVIEDFLKGNMAFTAAMSLVLVKGLIWSFSLGSGTSGGVLAPLLIMGSGLGLLESSFLPAGAATLWPLVSMAAVLGGVMRSPFTAILFAFELTHDEGALLPLLIATMAAHTFTVLVMKRSILTEKVARRGFHVFREYSVDILERVHVEEVMTKEVVTIPARMKVKALVRNYFTGGRKHRGYPVVDSRHDLVGVIAPSDILEHPSLSAIGEQPVRNLIERAPIVAYTGENCRQAASRMASHRIGRLPVVEKSNPLKVVGILSRSDLFKPSLKYLEEEDVREAFLLRRPQKQTGRNEGFPKRTGKTPKGTREIWQQEPQG
jgi:H+/Cl- antiporter ClcA/predicted transcriptional regulator